MKVIALAIPLAFALAGCRAPAVDVAEASGGVAPFASLRGVHLGMTARELERVRPAARPEAYTGYVERVDGFAVSYGIPGSASEEQVVSPGARVRSVSTGFDFTRIDAGVALWRRIVQTAETTLILPPVCSRFAVRSGVVGIEAEWKRAGSSFTAMLFEVPQTEGEPYHVRIGLAVSREPNRVGAQDGRWSVDCDADPSSVFHGPPG